MSEQRTPAPPIDLEHSFTKLPAPGPNCVVLVDKGLQLTAERSKAQREGRRPVPLPSGNPPRLPRNKPELQRDPPTSTFVLPQSVQPGESAATLDEVKVQGQAIRVGRCLVGLPDSPNLRYGCHSHRGPKKGWADKENEDYAFALHHRDRTSAAWALVGVADGVSGSTWGERGAEQACASFISVLCQMLEHYDDLERQMLEPGFREQIFAAALYANLQKRLYLDEREIVTHQILHPTWGAEGYRAQYFEGPNADAERRTWFQTTLLAAALGPRGGFALILGDGYARVTRRFADGSVQRRPLDMPKATEQGAPSLLISRWLQPYEIADSLIWLPIQDAVELELLLATDGVQKTPDSGVETSELRNNDDCRKFLDSLASRPEGQFEQDNMSVAFGAVVLASPTQNRNPEPAATISSDAEEGSQ